MKKILSLILVFLLCLSVLMPVCAYASSEEAETFSWSEGWGIAALIGILVALVAGNWICITVSKKYFDGAFGFFIGGLWGWAVLVTVCLLIPAAKPFLCTLLEAMIGMDGVVLPGPGSVWYWLLLLVSAGYTVIVWIISALGLEKNLALTTVLMLVMGTVYAMALYVLASAIIQALVLAIIVVVLIGMAAGHSSNTKKKDVSVTAVYGWGTKDLEVDETGTFYKDPETDDWVRIKRD